MILTAQYDLKVLNSIQFHPAVKNYKSVQSKLSLKVRTASAICWNYLGIFRDYGNKTFLFFKYLFEIECRETSQNFNSFSSFRQLLFSFILSVV